MLVQITHWLGLCSHNESSKNVYSRVHISSDEVFSKILKKPSIVQKKIMPHMKAFGLFNKMKQKKLVKFLVW